MRFELNEVEAREERYPSTISFLNLLNTLIAKETDTSDRGHRFCYFIFTYLVFKILKYKFFDLFLIFPNFTGLWASLGLSMITYLTLLLREPM